MFLNAGEMPLDGKTKEEDYLLLRHDKATSQKLSFAEHCIAGKTNNIFLIRNAASSTVLVVIILQNGKRSYIIADIRKNEI